MQSVRTLCVPSTSEADRKARERPGKYLTFSVPLSAANLAMKSPFVICRVLENLLWVVHAASSESGSLLLLYGTSSKI
jgi:hypothetical protein